MVSEVTPSTEDAVDLSEGLSLLLFPRITSWVPDLLVPVLVGGGLSLCSPIMVVWSGFQGHLLSE